MFSIITPASRLSCKKNTIDSPKSIPSETFPLATDNRIAPRPFSHAWEQVIPLSHLQIVNQGLQLISKIFASLGRNQNRWNRLKCWKNETIIIIRMALNVFLSWSLKDMKTLPLLKKSEVTVCKHQYQLHLKRRTLFFNDWFTKSQGSADTSWWDHISNPIYH